MRGEASERKAHDGFRGPKGESTARKVVGDRSVGTVQEEVHEHPQAGIWCEAEGSGLDNLQVFMQDSMILQVHVSQSLNL